jgi:hypothetical protein
MLSIDPPYSSSRAVIEVNLPGLGTLPPDKTSQMFDLSDEHIGIDEYDVANQGLISHWQREPFTNESTKHGSVWEKPA